MANYWQNREARLAWQREYDRAHAEQRRQRRQQNRTLVQAAVRALLGDACAQCGSTGRLQIDHINPTAKEREISRFVDGRRDLLPEELRKCQLLCASCHARKTRMEDKVHNRGRWGKSLTETAYS